MELFEAIAHRHSYRGPYRDTPVPRADLRRIVEAGLQAPSGCNAQTTAFVIVDKPELVRQINVMHANNKAVQQAKAFIVCAVDRNPGGVYEGMSFQVEDCAAAVQNMLLAITASGYASVWIDGWLRLDKRAEKIGSLLGLPDTKIIRILLPLGVPAEPVASARPKKPFAERAWFNKYGQAEE